MTIRRTSLRHASAPPTGLARTLVLAAMLPSFLASGCDGSIDSSGRDGAVVAPDGDRVPTDAAPPARDDAARPDARTPSIDDAGSPPDAGPPPPTGPRYVGRVDARDPASVRFSWSGSGMISAEERA